MDFSAIRPFKDNWLQVVIETPAGSRNKYAYDEEQKLMMLKKTLPLGFVFPFDFGFIANTRGEDGDPLDVLVLLDEPAVPGCLVRTRLIGVLRARQREKNGHILRNDRFIAVGKTSQNHQEIQSVEDLLPAFRVQVETFFMSYNSVIGKEFMPEGWKDASEARQLILE